MTETFNCPECNRPYKTENGLISHMEKKHDWSKPSHWTKDEYVEWLMEPLEPEKETK